MKLILASLLLSTTAALTQAATPPNPRDSVPKELEPNFAILTQLYPKFDQKTPKPKAPATKAWILRSESSAEGTVEVGFQGTEVIYMLFRRGAGGTAWKGPEIDTLFRYYVDAKLIKPYPTYAPSIINQISAAAITRIGFNKGSLATGN